MSFASGPPGSSSHLSLTALGYCDRWAALLTEAPPGAEPGRVVRDDRGSIVVAGDGWQQRLNLSRDLSAVTGDWVAVHDGAVVGLLDRATEITRRRGDAPQTLAANVDLVGLVHGLDQPLNRRRLERGLVMAWESGALPLVLLTKADLAADFATAATQAAGSAPGVDVLTLSVVDERGLDDLRALLQPHRTLGCWVPPARGSRHWPTPCWGPSRSRPARSGPATGAAATRRRTASSSSSLPEASCLTRRACAP